MDVHAIMTASLSALAAGAILTLPFWNTSKNDSDVDLTSWLTKDRNEPAWGSSDGSAATYSQVPATTAAKDSLAGQASDAEQEEGLAPVTLSDALSIYTYDFLSPETLAWVTTCSQDAAMSEDIEDNAWIAPVGRHDAAVLQASIDKRCPVYFGRPETDLFDEQRLEAVFGYGLRDLPEVPVKFALIAPNYAQAGRFYSVHAMGVNLESVDTVDYAEFVRSDGTLRLREYQAEVTAMVDAIKKCVDRFARHGSAVLRLPAIGCGAYLNAYRGSHDECKDALVKALVSVSLSRPAWTIDLCVTDLAGWPTSSGSVVITVGDLFDVAVSDDLFLVNAWDTVSFIGNGGTADPTIDGMTVAGIGSGAQLINCSYLHNPFFRSKLKVLR